MMPNSLKVNVFFQFTKYKLRTFDK